MTMIVLTQTVKTPLAEIDLSIAQQQQQLFATANLADWQIFTATQPTATDKASKGELQGFKKRLIERLNRDENTQRNIKLTLRRQQSSDAFPNHFRPTHKAKALLQEEMLDQRVSLSGRLMAKRIMGKASFIQLQDSSGSIQAYVQKDVLGDSNYQAFRQLDIGDIIGIRGTLFVTQSGELTVQTQSIELLTKSLLPLPEKYHGLKDTELRYRQRYVDLIINSDSRKVFIMRSQITQVIRQFFLDNDFLEVETPMMHPIPGGATAKPFKTHHHALERDLYLRIAPELYLKRLIVGGFERVFEINRSFRNEGLSTRHNPEFTMLEFYYAYADYQDLMDLTESLFARLATEVLENKPLQCQQQCINLQQPFQRLTMQQAIVQYNSHISHNDLQQQPICLQLLQDLGVAVNTSAPLGYLVNELFEQTVEDKLIQPTFITEYPIEVSPLARRNSADPSISDRFELFIGGREIANGFSELNDAHDQAQRFLQQLQARQAGDDEAMFYDDDYITALEYGMPPTAGQGIGIDRLTMLLCQQPSIRDVMLFPQLRPQQHSNP